MNKKNLKKQIGQLMIFGFDGTTPTAEIKELICDYHIGGIILFARNMGKLTEVLHLTTELQALAKNSGYEKPLLICIDQENGIVRRLGTGATVFPGAMLLGATGNTENAYLVGLATGRELKALGINWNLAPIVDVNNNPNNPVIGVRSYGEEPGIVTAFARDAIRGLGEVGIITTLKHFPGHGDTEVDSHLDLPVISHEMDRLERIELAPFKELIKGEIDSIMTSHVYFPAIEKTPGVPATLSKAIVTGLLRQYLGYNGVVTTDCMEMNAIKNTIGTVKGAVEAIKAGVDLVMISHSYNLQKASIEAIYEAVMKDEIKETELEAALARVTRLKGKYLFWEDINLDLNNLEVDPIIGCEKHRLLAQNIYKQGVTLYKNEAGLIPLSKDEKILVIYPLNSKLVKVEDVQYSNFSLENAIKEICPSVASEEISNPPTPGEVQRVLEIAKEYATIIIGTLSLTREAEQVKLIELLINMEKKIIVIAMKNPYDIGYIPKVAGYIATYEYTYPALSMAAKVIYGIEKVTGTMPVTIPNLIK